MKKIIFFSILVQIAAVCFAANPETDFAYKLSASADSVVITSFKNKLKRYEIPAEIQGIPVTAVEVKEQLGYVKADFTDDTEVTLKLPEGLKQFTLLQRSGEPKGHVIIESLPSTLEMCDIRSQRNRKNPEDLHISIKGTVNTLEKITEFKAQYVNFSEKKLIVKKTWASYDFLGSNFTEITFEEGCENIGRFESCNKITKVTLPSTVKKLDDNAFLFCTKLSDVIIPESVTTLSFGVNMDNFREVPLPLKQQILLKKLGYKGKFGTE